jgi:putative ABC transport system substrate-binding protein
MRRREFIGLLGCAAAAWPVIAHAQQPAMPVVGWLNIGSPRPPAMMNFRNGLREQGFVEGQNLLIERRFALNGQYAQLLELASDLVRLRVAVLFATGSAGTARAARAATATIPIVFSNGGDPITLGLVASLNRPGGNATGISFNTSTLVPKRLELLRELVPQAETFAFLVNPTNPVSEGDIDEMEVAARNVGRSIVIVKASNENEIDAAFANMAGQRVSAVLVDVDAYFGSRTEQLIALAVRYGIAASFNNRRYVEAGGLMSYGPDLDNAMRQGAIYVGRILNGEKPSELPVMQPTKYDLVVNLRTAKAIGLTISSSLMARADEVIE